MSAVAYFPDGFFSGLIFTALVLTGVAAAVLLGLLVRDWLKKEVW